MNERNRRYEPPPGKEESFFDLNNDEKALVRAGRTIDAANTYCRRTGSNPLKAINLVRNYIVTLPPHLPDHLKRGNKVLFHVYAGGDPTCGGGSHYATVDIDHCTEDKEYIESVRATLKSAFDKIFDARAHVLTDEEYQQEQNAPDGD